MSEEVKRCPCCNGEAERSRPREGSTTQYDFVRCKTCGCTADVVAWNRRPTGQVDFEKVVREWVESNCVEEESREFGGGLFFSPDCEENLITRLKTAVPANPAPLWEPDPRVPERLQGDEWVRQLMGRYDALASAESVNVELANALRATMTRLEEWVGGVESQQDDEVFAIGSSALTKASLATTDPTVKREVVE